MSVIGLVLLGAGYGVVGLIVAAATFMEGRVKGFRPLPHALLSLVVGIAWPLVVAAVLVAARFAGVEADAVERPARSADAEPGRHPDNGLACPSAAA